LSPVTIDAEVLEKEILKSKVCTPYSSKDNNPYQVQYRSEGDTRLTINGSRHYKTPFGSLPSVTTILGATQGSKAALERWSKKNPGKKEEAARRGTAVHSRMEHYLLGDKSFEHEANEDPEFLKDVVDPFWDGLSEKLDKFENVIWAENPANDDFQWTIGGDGISRVWSPGTHETEVRGWAGAPDIIATYQGKVVLGDLKTSNGLYFGRWPGPDTPREEYGMRRAGFIKYQKCCMQLAAYDIGIRHTIGIKPDIHMIIVSTTERNQVFAIQGRTIQKYKEKWMKCVDKYYEEFHNIPEIEMEVVDLDKAKG
tara:strand:- start:986 stop:1918 length:933 start_codon:yes stop_codon:yes gene_type:complete